MQKNAKYWVKRAARDAVGTMMGAGRYTVLIGSFLFCLLATLATWSVGVSFAFLLDVYLLPLCGELTVLVLSVAYYVLLGALFWLLALPLWQGRWRMAGRMLQGAAPELYEIFYYYGNRRRLVRAWAQGFLWLLDVAAPAAGLILAVSHATRAVSDAFARFSFGTAMLTLAVAVLAVAAVAALAVLWWVLLGHGVAVAIGNERLPILEAQRIALRAARRHFTVTLRFVLHSLLWLLYAALTLGLALLLYGAHRYILSYFSLSMAICPKGEEEV